MKHHFWWYSFFTLQIASLTAVSPRVTLPLNQLSQAIEGLDTISSKREVSTFLRQSFSRTLMGSIKAPQSSCVTSVPCLGLATRQEKQCDGQTQGQGSRRAAACPGHPNTGRGLRSRTTRHQ